jgi:hypothetical protein
MSGAAQSLGLNVVAPPDDLHRMRMNYLGFRPEEGPRLVPAIFVIDDFLRNARK